HPGTVVPASVENSDFSCSWEMLNVALDVHLTLFPIRRRRQGYHSKDPRTYALGNRTNGAALTGRVTTLKDDNHAETLVLDPILKFAKFRLQPTQLLFVLLAFQAPVTAVLLVVVCHWRVTPCPQGK